MSSLDDRLPGETPIVNLTLRMIMHGKEVGPIIGKGGEIINSIREEAGAKIHITDGSCPERIITVTGTTDVIFKAYTLICKKMEDEDGSRTKDRSADRKDSLTLHLVVPASQCGSLIGKGGCKIKEIREVTGASVQVASDPLPGSTERSVTVTGSRDAVTQCVYHICCVMLESPAKGTIVQYQPGRGGLSGRAMMGGRGDGRGPSNPLAGLLGFGGGGASTLAAIASIAGSQIRRHDRGDREDRDRESTYQMSVPNELIGSVIGKGGSKIAEIRQMSGAMIRISKSDDPDASPTTERHIQITGNPDSVALAKSLINMSLDLHKASLERGGSNDDDRDDDHHHNRRDDRDDRRDRYRDHQPDMGLASLLAKPDVLAAVNLIGQLGSLGGGFGGGMGGFVEMNRGRSSYGGSGRSRDEDRRDSKRSKFAPY
eukprot:GFUD01004299.1.p1 GENE.GFUD01004299.1~~GFUD01004299.1.p1  ORF type:complete len:429 (-),score=129.11 GFUD01004299.1:263-1549(-)